MNKKTEGKTRTGLEVAVIGMSGRFPGARSCSEFWENLKNGVESITFFSDEELEAAGVDSLTYQSPHYVKARGILDDIEYFDASFFEYIPGEAEIMNPQLRIFLECSWEALEDAGYNPDTYDGLIGVYAGASSSSYWEALAKLSGKSDDVGMFAAGHLAGKDFMSTTISYKLNLQGPSSVIHTACSTSLVAVHYACRAVLSGECQIALAGGVAAAERQREGYVYKEGMILSTDGHCRAFAAEASGTIGGNGIGIVVLKRLKNAIKDRDHIYAVVKGSAINNDGRRKVGFTTPSVDGQAEAIKTALAMARVEPESISYLETHGTGTKLGDPVEIEALTLAFNTTKKGFCPIGSVKSNVGHLDSAAGVAGFIKTVLALKYRLIPPSLNFENPNPGINFADSPFFVNSRLKQWENDEYPLRAGVSSFGIGGTNAHVILEEWPENGFSPQQLPNLSTPRLILLSAKTPTGLDRIKENLVENFRKNPGINLADAAYTLQAGRKAFKHRMMTICSTIDEAAETLSTCDLEKVYSSFLEEENRPIMFMFSGQGSQYVNMGLDLYKKEPYFSAEMDRCFEILEPIMGRNLKKVIYPGLSHPPDRGELEPAADINRTENTQPLIFIIEYALASLLMKWGIKPFAMIGHSIGEYVAAHLSGLFSLEDALKLVAFRGKLMQEMPAGAMLGVPIREQELLPLMNKELSLAAVNSSAHCVVSGTHEAIEAFRQQLLDKGYKSTPLFTSHAFHSRMMDPILKAFEEKLSRVKFDKPVIPYISNLTGNWIRVNEAGNPGYWSSHLRNPVRFAAGLEKLLKEEQAIFIEVGPGKTLSTFVRQHDGRKKHHSIINLVRHPKEEAADHFFLLDKIGHLWLSGAEIDWSEFYSHEQRCRVSLPTYPFERQRFWIEGDPFKMVTGMESSAAVTKRKAEMKDWFYYPTWEPADGKIQDSEAEHLDSNWLIFLDECGLGTCLLEALNESTAAVITVKPGPGFNKVNDVEYEIDPAREQHYDLLFRELKKSKKVPGKIIHLWGVTRPAQKYLTMKKVEKFPDAGFYSILNTVRAADRESITGSIRIGIVTNNMQQVNNKGELYPEKALIQGAVKVIPREYTNISCCSVDIDFPTTGTGHKKRICGFLLAEFAGSNFQGSIAYRGEQRYIQDFKPLKIGNNRAGTLPLKTGGVYLVTGGLGGIGLTLAGFLAEKYKARLILTGRSTIPNKKDWREWVANHPQDDPVSQKIGKLQELEQKGGQVIALSADVTRLKQMQAVISLAKKNFGEINGVIHSAGLADGGIIRLRTREKTAGILAPKVQGTLVLEYVLKEQNLDFFYLCSSLSSITAPLGQVGYCAANAFLDAYAHYRTVKNGTFTLSIDWDAWQEVGMAAEAAAQLKKITAAPDSESMLAHGILPAEGIEVFCRSFEFALPQIVVSTGDLKTRIKETGKYREEEITPPGTLYPRPELSNRYAAPGREMELRLAAIWQGFFGIEKIGIYDDFFELGGDSLKALAMAAKIHKNFNVEIGVTELFNNPTIKKLSQYIEDSAPKSTFVPISAVEREDYYLLSAAQKRLYILQQMNPENIGYNMTGVVKLEGELSKTKLEESVRKLIDRHESLRTSFAMIKGNPVQLIHDPGDIEFKIESLSVPQKRGGSAPINHLVSQFVRPFDLSKAPLLRVGLINTGGSGSHILMIDMHHIISDGTSVSLFVKEFIAFFGAESLPGLPIQYKDYAVWQNSKQEIEAVKKQEKYWLEEYSGEVPVLALPTDFVRPLAWNYEGAIVKFDLGNEETGKLKLLAQQEEATLFMVLFSLFNILLAKICSQEEIVIGMPAAGRKHPDLEPLIGMFVNTLALRNFPSHEKSYREFLKEVRDRTLTVFENQDYQFEDLVEKVNITRDISRNPLFDVMFSVQDIELPMLDIAGLKVTPCEHETKIAKFDMSWNYLDTGAGLLFEIGYGTKLFKEGTIERFCNYFKEIVSAVIKNEEIIIGEIEILTDMEKQQILFDFNDSAAEFPAGKTLHRLFSEQVVKTPDKIAVFGPAYEPEDIEQDVGAKHLAFRQDENASPLQSPPSVHMSYRELNRKAGQLARLLSEKDVKPNTIVALLVGRSIEMIAAIFAILEAGSAYLPISPDYPEARKRYILQDSGASFILTTRSREREVEQFSGLQVETVFSEDCSGESRDHPAGKIGVGARRAVPSKPATCSLQPVTSPLNLAYVIYTSGTTGNPKGVLVEHRSAVNVVTWFAGEYGVGPGFKVLLLSDYTFDASIDQVFGTLLHGAELHVIGKELLLDVDAQRQYIKDKGINLVNFVPAMLKELLCYGEKLESIKVVIAGGEQLEQPTKDEIIKRGYRLYNHYGPTETTVEALVSRCSDGKVTLGRPVANTKCRILGKNLEIQPIGIIGELCISGAGTARGYLNNPELTAEKFIKAQAASHKPQAQARTHQLSTHQLIYRSGDLARWLPDGEIEFLGRIDHQVKIRGFRIEPGGIKNQLLRHEKVKDAVVLAKEDQYGDKYLCAYIVAESRQESANPEGENLVFAGEPDHDLDNSELRSYLSRNLPRYMIPKFFIQLEQIPLTPGGKIDKKALPEPTGLSTGLKTGYAVPLNDNEKVIAETWKEILHLEEVGRHDNFFDSGGNSLLLVRLGQKLKERFNRAIPVVAMFNYPTVASLAGYLKQQGSAEGAADKGIEWAGELERNREKLREVSAWDKRDPAPGSDRTGMEIAVIGMAARFPGAGNIAEFWDNLKNGVESTTFFSIEELEEMGLSEAEINNPNYVRAKGVLQDSDCFAAAFFGYTPAEAAVMDPQIRVFHECTWEALENAGYDPESYQGSIGLYAGASSSSYWEVLSLSSASSSDIDTWEVQQLNNKDRMATQVSYKLNLKGPAVAVQTACSTSLVAIDLACQGLLSGKCDIAAAGGVSITLQDRCGYFYKEGMVLSPEGRCRAFAADAKGIVPANGAGIVVLKRLDEAISGRDNIYAVIKGSAANNDGKRKVGYTAPSVAGQVEVIRAAQRMAGVNPESISYIEAHGTGTILGDPIEVEALTQAFNTSKRGFCGIGSVKTNFGHLDTAAGAAGFIKTVLALKYREIPPTLHFSAPNPGIDFANSPFYVNSELKEWQAKEYPLRAGVSSLGIGGTNVHVILEEYKPTPPLSAPLHGRGSFQLFNYYRDSKSLPVRSPLERGGPPQAGRGVLKTSQKNKIFTHSDAERKAQSAEQRVTNPDPVGANLVFARDALILLSARTRSALDRVTGNLKTYLEENRDVNIADAAFTLQVGRRAFKHRRVLICSDLDDALTGLSSIQNRGKGSFFAKEDNRPIIFLFSGHGSQYVNMGLELYREEPFFRQQLDHCFDILRPITGCDIKKYLYPAENDEEAREAEEKIKQFVISSPLKFAFEYSLAKLLLHWGIKPDAMIGHSFGEYAAACLAGVFSLEDTAALVALRGELMHRMPAGTMMNVLLPEEKIVPFLNEEVALAAVNGPAQCIVSGADDAVDDFEKRVLQEYKDVECQRLRIPRASHSPMMDPVIKELQQRVSRVKLNNPKIPYISGLSGTWIRPEEATDSRYWARHLRETMRFHAGLTELLKMENAIFIQVGADRNHCTLVAQHPDSKKDTLALNLVKHHKDKVSDIFYLVDKISRLWLSGYKIDWTRFHDGEERYRVPLPTYPFDKQSFKLNVDPLKAGSDILTRHSFGRQEQDVSNWFYVPTWQSSLRLPARMEENRDSSPWLVLVDEVNFGSNLVRRIERQDKEVILVKAAGKFDRVKDNLYTIDPRQGADYDRLFADLKKLNRVPGRILHLWNVTGLEEDKGTKIIDRLDRAQDLGFFSLLYLAKAIGKLDFHRDHIFHVLVVTDLMQEAPGAGVRFPEKSTVLGAVKVIPLEYPNIKCRSIDIALPPPGTGREDRLLVRLLQEFSADIPGQVIAYRDTHRLVQSFEPVKMKRRPQIDTLLRREGVYLVTGGTGGIGLQLATYLARELQARLILTGRSSFPPREAWQEYLAGHDEADSICRKIRKVLELEQVGSEVMVFAADVGDRENMLAVIEEAEKSFGPINGVIHCAGLPDGAMIQLRTKETSENVLAAKLKGTLVLDDILQNRELDCFILCSSLSSVVAPFGQAAYCAANTFLDSFAHFRTLRKAEFTTALDWDRWKNVGMALIPEQKHKELTGEELEGGMKAEEALDVFSRSLAAAAPQLVISTRDLQQRLEYSQEAKTGSSSLEEKDEQPAGTLYKRPDLSSEYAAPRNRIERAVSRIYQKLFGLDQVGILDDFFELGGDSLKAMTISANIHKTLDIKVPVAEVFSKPTIEELSVYIEKGCKISTYSTIDTAEKKEYYPLSSAQKRMFILNQFGAGSTGYNSPQLVKLEGVLDKEKFEKTFRQLIDRHESLRTSFEIINDHPVQKVHEPAGIVFKIEYDEINSLQEVSGIGDNQGRGEPCVRPSGKTAVGARRAVPLEIPSYGFGGAAPRMPEGRGGLDAPHNSAQRFIRPFDLSQAPLFRVALVKCGLVEDVPHHILMVDKHHIITDGISGSILIKEFMTLYKGENPSPLRIQYKDYAAGLCSSPEIAALKQQEEYWKQQFAGEVPILDLPADYVRPAAWNFKGRSLIFAIGEQETASLNRVARDYGATLFMVLLSVYNIVLAKLSGQEDIIVGTPTAGRPHADLEPVIGMFVNTLGLRNYPDRDKKFSVFLKEVKERTLAAFENQDYQFEDLVEQLSLSRDTSRNPLFDATFVLQNIDIAEFEIPGLKLLPCEYETGTAKFDITLEGYETGQNLKFHVEYCPEIFKQATVERFINYFKKCVTGIIADSEKVIAGIEIIPGNEKRQLLFDFNDTAADYPQDMTIHRLFEKQVGKTPDHVAVTGSEDGRGLIHLSYRRLNEKANRSARLLQSRGLQTGEIVGILLKPSLEMLSGIIAVLKAGGAYLPLDLNNPAGRIRCILHDCGLGILFTYPANEKEYPGCEIIAPGNEAAGKFAAANPVNKVRPGDLLYVIYTSGSTGNPKGALIRHQGFINMVCCHEKVFAGEGMERRSQVASPGFDAMAFEIWPCLLNGAALVIAGEEIRMNPGKMKDWLIKHRINLSFQPTLMAEQLLQEEWPAQGTALKVLQAAGDRLSCYPARSYPFRFYNLYGPTEAAVWATWTEVAVKKAGDPAYPVIGRPIANFSVYILGPGLNLKPIGAAGELCLSGDGLAQGYLNRPELTAGKFVTAPATSFKPQAQARTNQLTNSSTHSLVYRTGDLARWHPDGNIEFLGRIDQQIKIRGFRIELGEIENRLLKHEAVKEAVVLMQSRQPNQAAPGHKYICAYMVPGTGNTPTNAELKNALSRTLPDYMLPAYFLWLAEIPLTPAGKPDLKALPVPEAAGTGVDYTPPGDELERKLAAIWAEVLHTPVQKIGIDADFFELGGHSLTATILIAKIHQEFDVKLPLQEVFRSSTIRGLAEYIRGGSGEAIRYYSIKAVERKEFYPLSSAQTRLYFLQLRHPESTSYNIPEVMVLAGSPELEKLQNTFTRLIGRHEIFRTSFELAAEEPVQKIHDPGDIEFAVEYDDIDIGEKQGRGEPCVRPSGKTGVGARRAVPLEIPYHGFGGAAPRMPEGRGGLNAPHNFAQRFIRPFDLSKAPLLRVGLTALAEKEYILIVDMHHIISDGGSTGVLVRDFAALYTGEELPGLRIHYKDFSRWQLSEKKEEKPGKQEEYWLQQFSGELPVLNLPLDFKRREIPDFAADQVSLNIDHELTGKIRELVSDSGSTLFMVLLAAYNILLAKFAGSEDIVIGTPVSGRVHADLQNVIGMFVNMLALRNRPAGGKTFYTFLHEVKENTLKALENQEYQFEELVRVLDIQRNPDRNPLFDAIYVMQNAGEITGQESTGLKIKPFAYQHIQAKYDLSLTAVETGSSLAMKLVYSTALFKRSTAERIAEYFIDILNQVIGDREIPLEDISISHDLLTARREVHEVEFGF